MRGIENKGRSEFPNNREIVKKDEIDKPCAADMPTEVSKTELPKVQKIKVKEAANKCFGEIGYIKVVCATLNGLLKTDNNTKQE